MMKPILLAACAVITTGCATIFNGESQPVNIQSVPEGAQVTIVNRAGEKIHVGAAPITLPLKRGAGYFKSEQYTLKFEKEGFTAMELTITGTVSGWYIGNLVFGGLIGFLAVDPITGAMYTLPETVRGSLEALPAKSGTANTLTIVSTEYLTTEQKQQAQPLGVTAQRTPAQ